MATLDYSDSNILDAEAINWRLIVYPIVAVVVLVLGGFGYYYYQQNEKDEREADARAALLQAKTPEEMVKVADQFSSTDQAILARLSAANEFFAKKDYASADKEYQQIIGAVDTDEGLRDSAQLGLASSLEAGGHVDEAINTYLIVARRGTASPYAPFAFNAMALIYEQRGDKQNERQILMEAASTGIDSQFVKQAAYRLKALNAEAQPLVLPADNTTAPATNAAPVKP